MSITDQENGAPDLEQFRSYLRLLAEQRLNPRLRVKASASDIVQQTMLDAHRDFAGFRGKTELELRAWLRAILVNNLLTVAKRYATDKRDIGHGIFHLIQMLSLLLITIGIRMWQRSVSLHGA